MLQRAVWLHNKYAIPETEKADRLLFSRLIRDADKLDILGLIVEHLEMRISNPNLNRALDFGLIEKPGFSRQVAEDIFDGKMVRIAALNNLNDMRLMYLSWVFDINFPVTLSIIKERGYLEKLRAACLRIARFAKSLILLTDICRKEKGSYLRAKSRKHEP